jgi:hypothetical protein
MALFGKAKNPGLSAKPFGECCPDMQHAMSHGATRLLRVEDNGVFYMAVGAAETPQGIGWFDQAVLFCPFCGVPLQTREQIARAPRL